jgi:hypothetical protein
MRKLLLVLTLAGATMIAPGLTPAAHAYGWFSVGTGFRVGPLSLSFVLGQPFRSYAPAYYYRAYQPIAYSGYHCTDRCFVDHGVYYHDRACPVVRHYLAEYRVDPYDSYVRYAPRYDGYYDDGYYERHGAYYDGGYGYSDGYYDGGYGGGYGGGLYVDGSVYLGGSYGRGYRGYYDRGYSGHRDYDRRDFGRRDNDRREDRRDFRNDDRRHDDRRDHDRGDHRDHDRGDRGDHGDRRHDDHRHH